MVLKIATGFERVQSALILYDPPSQLNTRTTWDDGQLGTSVGCDLSNVLLAQKIQYIHSLIKLTRRAGEIILGQQMYTYILLEIPTPFVEISLYIQPNTHFSLIINKLDEKGNTLDGFHNTKVIHGNINDTGVYINRNGSDEEKEIAENIMEFLVEKCKEKSSSKGKLLISYPNSSYHDEFSASLCIKR